jgi:hypothetical protein
MKTQLSLTLAAAASVVAFTGCQHQEGAYLPKETAKYNYENTEPVVLMDRMVQRSIAVPAVQRTPLPDGRMEVVANLRNRETRRIQVQVQCEFKDAQGFPVDSTEWRNVILTENAQEGVKFLSMNDKAQRFTVRVRQAH